MFSARLHGGSAQPAAFTDAHEESADDGKYDTDTGYESSAISTGEY